MDAAAISPDDAAAICASAKPQAEAIEKSVDSIDVDLEQPLYFRFSEANLSNSAVEMIERIAARIEARGAEKVIVAGFASSRESAAPRKKLAEQRADIIRNALAERGVSEEAIEIISCGPRQTAHTGTPAKGVRARKSEIIIEFDDS